MARIDVYVHGRGRGHGTRCAVIVDRLRAEGHAVHTYAGPDARDVLGHPPDVTPVDSMPPRLDARALPRLARRVRAAVVAARHRDVDLVVSDGDLPAVIAGRILGLPVIAVGHGLVFARCRRPPELPRARWWREAAKAWLSSVGASAHVAVSFVPLASPDADTIVARPKLDVPPRGPTRHHVLCYFRDGNGGALVRAVVAAGYVPIVFGELDATIDGVVARPFDRDAFVAALVGARAVVASAGSQLIAECSSLGVPLFAAHRDDDDEQALNVAMLRAAAMGDGAAFGPGAPAGVRAFLARAHLPGARAWAAPDVAEATARTAARLLAGAA